MLISWGILPEVIIPKGILILSKNLRGFGVKIWTKISIRVKKLTFSMSVTVE